jgi:hypothetical protein
MKHFKIIKTNIVESQVDDVVKNLKELKNKTTWLEGNVYQDGMLVFVQEKQAIYKMKEVE